VLFGFTGVVTFEKALDDEALGKKLLLEDELAVGTVIDTDPFVRLFCELLLLAELVEFLFTSITMKAKGSKLEFEGSSY